MFISRFLFGSFVIITTTSTSSAAPITNAIPSAARPISLSEVRLTDGPLKQAQDLDKRYLLQLEPDRMMAYYRIRAGLTPKAKGYDGWDGDGKNLTGHIAGHYLSAISLMYAATGDRQFKERVDYLVKEMKEVQEKNGNGYLGALQDGQEKFAEVSRGDIRSGGFDLNGLWSPWYVLHKTYAGLRDAYRFTGNREALELEIKFAQWAESVVSPLSEAQMQKMLNTEFGGMDEVFADLYADTGDKRWLELSLRFKHHSVIDPLEASQDKLGGLHANTQVPKAIGSLARYIYSGDKKEGDAANFFWNTVVKNHTFATGGHGKDEYFGPAGELSARTDGRTDESCNVYNMLKMTRTLFAIQPDIKYAEYEERALFNHVLGSIDPKDGRTCYMVPIGRGVHREYQDMQHNFTCCVGSGMESHALHGDGIYYENGNRLWVNLYTPSIVNWKSQGAKLTVATTFPEGETADIKLAVAKPTELVLALRRPSWAGDGFAVKINGKSVKNVSAAGSYIELKRRWKNGDTVSLVLPKTLYKEGLPDNPDRAAIMWGPLVLAGDMSGDGEKVSTPVFVSSGQPVSQWLQSVPNKRGHFQSVGVGRDVMNSGKEKEVVFEPFYRLHNRTYSAYFDFYSPQQWKQKSAQIAAEEARQRRLEAATISFVQTGQMQPERDYNQLGEETEPDRTMGRTGRRGKKWFSFDMPVDPTQPMKLVLTYNSDEWRNRTFDVLIDGKKISEQKVERKLPGAFYDSEIKIPAETVVGKQKATIRFQATNGNEIAAIYGIRVVRDESQ